MCMLCLCVIYSYRGGFDNGPGVRDSSALVMCMLCLCVIYSYRGGFDNGPGVRDSSALDGG